MLKIPFFEKRRLQPKENVRPSFKNETQAIATRNFKLALNEGDLSEIETNCPICNSPNFQDISSVDRLGLPVRTVLCQCCPTMYSRNRLDDRSLELFYRKFYRPLYGGIVEPTESWFREQSLNGGRILEWLKQNGFGRDGFRGKRVVDIGAGAGGGLIPFIECGAEALGIDFDENFLDFGRKHGVVMEVGGINDLKDYGLFDLVILKDVLEHLPNPSKAIAQVRQSLKSDGVCFIQVPGFQSLKHLGYQNDLLRYFQVAHLVHFTKESLTLLVESGGMNVHVADNRVWMIATRRDAPKNIESNHCDNFQAKVALRSIFRLRRFTAIEFYILRHLPPICKSALRFLIRR